MPTKRAIVLLRMREAIQANKSFNQLYREAQEKGLSYRRTDMLKDWRDTGNMEKKEGTARYIRKGYVPATNTVELKAWEMSSEYMYRVSVKGQIYPDKPLEKQFVNLMSDRPLTVEQVEARMSELIATSEKYKETKIAGLQVWSVYKRKEE